MIETIAPAQNPAESAAAESPQIPRPETDGAALRALEEATAHVRERALKIRQNPEQRHIQDGVGQILAKIDPRPAEN